MKDKEEFAVHVRFNQKQSGRVICLELMYMARLETNVEKKNDVKLNQHVLLSLYNCYYNMSHN